MCQDNANSQAEMNFQNQYVCATKCMSQFKSQFKREKMSCIFSKKKIDFNPHDNKWQLSSL